MCIKEFYYGAASNLILLGRQKMKHAYMLPTPDAGDNVSTLKTPLDGKRYILSSINTVNKHNEFNKEFKTTQYTHDVVLTSIQRRFNVIDVVWTSKR